MADDNAVKVMLEDADGGVHEVHSCNSVQAAEEWIVDHGDRGLSEAGKYDIRAPEGMMDDYVEAANGATDTTEVDAKPPLNHLARALNAVSLLMTAIEDGHTGTDLQIALTEGAEVLEVVWADDGVYGDMPELREFDELSTQGRETLIDWIEDGRPTPELVEPIRMIDGTDITVARPMSRADTLVYLRERADEIVQAVGYGASSFAIPGIRDIARRLDKASKIATPEEFEEREGPRVGSIIGDHAVTLAEFKQGRSKMSRLDLQLVADEG